MANANAGAETDIDPSALDPKSFFDVLKARRSVRAYARRNVEEGTLANVLECARAAPSAGNLQAYRVFVVSSPHGRKSLAHAAFEQGWLEQAPVVLVFFQDKAMSAERYGTRGAELYSVQDATIACAYAQLAGAALGLATCWVGAFEPEAVGRLFDAQEEQVPVALLTLGYPAEAPEASPRRPLRDIVGKERY